MKKNIALAVVLMLVGCFLFADYTFADEWEDNRAAERAEAAAEEEEYYLRQEDAEEDHERGIENSDSYHSLEEHNDRNKNDY